MSNTDVVTLFIVIGIMVIGAMITALVLWATQRRHTVNQAQLRRPTTLEQSRQGQSRYDRGRGNRLDQWNR